MKIDRSGRSLEEGWTIFAATNEQATYNGGSLVNVKSSDNKEVDEHWSLRVDVKAENGSLSINIEDDEHNLSCQDKFNISFLIPTEIMLRIFKPSIQKGY